MGISKGDSSILLTMIDRVRIDVSMSPNATPKCLRSGKRISGVTNEASEYSDTNIIISKTATANLSCLICNNDIIGCIVICLII